MHMHVEYPTDRLRVLAGVRQQDCMQVFGNPTVIGLFEPPPHRIALTGREGKQAWTHGQSPQSNKPGRLYQQSTN